MRRTDGNNRRTNLVALPIRKPQAAVRDISDETPGRESPAGVVRLHRRPSKRSPSESAVTIRHEHIKLLKDMCVALTATVEILEKAPLGASDAEVDFSRGVSFYEEVRRFESNLIRRALQHAGGNQTRAAALLGINHTTLHAMIKRYHIKTPRF